MIDTASRRVRKISFFLVFVRIAEIVPLSEPPLGQLQKSAFTHRPSTWLQHLSTSSCPGNLVKAQGELLKFSPHFPSLIRSFFIFYTGALWLIPYEVPLLLAVKIFPPFLETSRKSNTLSNIFKDLIWSWHIFLKRTEVTPGNIETVQSRTWKSEWIFGITLVDIDTKSAIVIKSHFTNCKQAGSGSSC